MKNTFLLFSMLAIALCFNSSCSSTQEDVEIEKTEDQWENLLFSVEMDGITIETTPSARPVYTGPLTPIGTIPENCFRWEVVWVYDWEECGDGYKACAGIVSSAAACATAINNCISNMNSNQNICSTACAPAVCWG